MGRKAAVLVLSALAVGLAPVAVAWACTPPGFGTPALSLSAGQAIQGRSVTVTGMGFAPPTAVSIALTPDPGPGLTTVLGEATPNATGQISATVTIPDVPPGPYMITAANQGPAPFEVIARPPAAPADISLPPSAPDPAQPVFGLAADAPAPAAIAASADGAPPSATARLVGGSRLATVLRRGLAFSIAASEACHIDGRASLSVPAAKSLGLPAIVARRSTSLAGRGSSTLVMRLSQRARQGLRRQRSASLRVMLTLTDRAGNRSFLLRTVHLRR
jgi:hypothetical protein